MSVPLPRITNAGTAACVRRVAATMFNPIMFSIVSISDCNNGAAVPTPALFTSIVNLASCFRVVSIRAKSSFIVKSASKTSTARPVSSFIREARRVESSPVAGDERQIVATPREAFRISGTNSARCSRY